MLAYAPRPALEVGVKAGYAPAAALDLSGREASKRPPAPLDAARDLADEPHGLSADEARRAPSAQRAGTHRSGVVSRLMPRLPQPLIEEVLSPDLGDGVRGEVFHLKGLPPDTALPFDPRIPRSGA